MCDNEVSEFKVEYCGVFVNVYLIDKAYGGPEEGGWWYEVGKAIRSKQGSCDADARDARGDEQAWCDEENKNRMSDINSFISEGRYVVYVEDWPGQDFPRQRPHYE